jgi:hypothetical protein
VSREDGRSQSAIAVNHLSQTHKPGFNCAIRTPVDMLWQPFTRDRCQKSAWAWSEEIMEQDPPVLPVALGQINDLWYSHVTGKPISHLRCRVREYVLATSVKGSAAAQHYGALPITTEQSRISPFGSISAPSLRVAQSTVLSRTPWAAHNDRNGGFRRSAGILAWRREGLKCAESGRSIASALGAHIASIGRMRPPL